MSPTSLAADLVVAQQHEPPAGAHFVLLAGVAATALAILGVRWWRGRHDAASGDEQSTFDDRSTETTDPTEDD